MFLETVKSRGLSHNSYVLADEGEALVVDPRRDCLIYSRIAERECSKIKYVLETHRNEDYVIGSLELQKLTEAEIAHSKKTSFRYGEHALSHGEWLELGGLRVEALYTPGHTDDSMCYAVRESGVDDDPFMVFTGDTLFAGNVGRTDLPGLDVWEEQSGKLYESLHERVLPLGDHVTIYPAHGAGSVCGSSISDREISTLGYERRTNPVLALDRESFIEHMMGEKLLRPPYFRKMEHYNLHGPPLLQEAPVPRSMRVKEFQVEMESPSTVIVDARQPSAFAGSHIPGSLNIWLDGLSLYPGWVLNHDQRILLVTDREEDASTAKAYLWRLGYDNLAGHLCSGIKGWRNRGKAVDNLGTLSAAVLKERLERREMTLLDVREPREWEEGHVKGAENIYVGHLTEHANRLNRDQPLAVTCGWGGRGGLGASILKKLGFKEVYNVLGGMRAWMNSGYPVEDE